MEIIGDVFESKSYGETCETIEEGIEKTSVWDELGEMRSKLNSLGHISTVKEFIHTNLTEEVETLRALFDEEFRDLPKDNPLRLEVLQTLAELGITIYTIREEEDEDTDEDKVIVEID